MPRNLIARLFSSPQTAPITIVSGLPRSGTSMLMQILHAGGMEIMTDHVRTADEDNPKGYYEFERVKKLREGDIKWVKDAQGKAVKIISALLEYLPAKYHYKVIFMRRAIIEILASQEQMLIRQNTPSDSTDAETMAELFKKHLQSVETWLIAQPNIQVLYIQYDRLLADPEAHIQSIAAFLGGSLDTNAMMAVPDRQLYRQRRSSDSARVIGASNR